MAAEWQPVPKEQAIPRETAPPILQPVPTPGRKITSNDHQRMYIYHGFMFTILCMKMRRRMFVKEHFYADAEETADLRHVELLSLATLGRDLRVSYR